MTVAWRLLAVSTRTRTRTWPRAWPSPCSRQRSPCSLSSSARPCSSPGGACSLSSRPSASFSLPRSPTAPSPSTRVCGTWMATRSASPLWSSSTTTSTPPSVEELSSSLPGTRSMCSATATALATRRNSTVQPYAARSAGPAPFPATGPMCRRWRAAPWRCVRGPFSSSRTCSSCIESCAWPPRRAGRRAATLSPSSSWTLQQSPSSPHAGSSLCSTRSRAPWPPRAFSRVRRRRSSHQTWWPRSWMQLTWRLCRSAARGCATACSASSSCRGATLASRSPRFSPLATGAIP
mmetsp:Transcript_11554/g.31182  ORF Transcript_11554/g.31182 Transcript_11554/m.31182 type:complete len:292 (-) Transcript_11554:942-1817(-)